MDVYKYKRNWIKPGMQVCHIDNPTFTMRAEEIVRKDRKLPPSESFPDGSIASLVIGIRCSWFEDYKGSSRARYMVYHTNTLIPAEIALEGPEMISKFIHRFRNISGNKV